MNKEKPTSIRVNDFKEGLIQLVNESGLPACVLEVLIRNTYIEVLDLKNRELKGDTEKYQQELANLEKNKNNSKITKEG